MKNIIYLFVSIILLSLLVELFSPAKKMKKSIMTVFSFVVIFLILSESKNLIGNINNYNSDFNFSMEDSIDDLMYSNVQNTSVQLIQLLKNEGIDSVYDIKISYEVDNYNIKLISVEVFETDDLNNEKIVKILTSFLNEIDEEDIVFR